MRRRILLAAVAAGAALGFAPAAHASLLSDPVGWTEAFVAGQLDRFNNDPGGNSRHVCIIDDTLDFYRCLYVSLP